MSSPKTLNRLPSLGLEIAADMWKSPVRPTSQSPVSLSSTSQQQQQQQSRAGRFAFSNKLASRFYQDNTIMGATKRTHRKSQQAAVKAGVWDAELERLQTEIQEVLELEKQYRAQREKIRLTRLAKENASASSIQRAYRLFRILHHRSRRRKKTAAITLRRMLGGATGRAYAKDATDRINAELLQAVLGGSLNGLDPVAYAKYRRDSYAKDLQQWWRHMMAQKQRRQALHLFAILLLQRVFRGNLGRLRARKLAEIKARQNLLNMALSGIGRIAFEATKSKIEKKKKENLAEEKKPDNWLNSKKKKKKMNRRG